MKDDKQTIYIVSMGPGDERLRTKETEEILEQCDCYIGAKRLLASVLQKRMVPCLQSYRTEEIVSYIQAHPEHHTIGILCSGDMGYYSVAKNVIEKICTEFPQIEVIGVPGVSSIVYFMDRLGVAWDDTVLTSCHGCETSIIETISRNKKVCTLLGGDQQLAEICKQLVEIGYEDIKVTVGQRLSYPDESMEKRIVAECVSLGVDTLTVALFENDNPVSERLVPGMEDTEFIRGKTPMTKQEIRTLVLSKMNLTEDAIIYDVGAGTGSVSVEAALLVPKGKVYAIEPKDEALELIAQNKRKFHVSNLQIVPGLAPQVLEDLPAPTHVFVGGSAGHMVEIVESVWKKKKDAVIVATAVTMESIAELLKVEDYAKTLRGEDYSMEMTQIAVTKTAVRGGYHMLQAANPITIARL